MLLTSHRSVRLFRSWIVRAIAAEVLQPDKPSKRNYEGKKKYIYIYKVFHVFFTPLSSILGKKNRDGISAAKKSLLIKKAVSQINHELH